MVGDAAGAAKPVDKPRRAAPGSFSVVSMTSDQSWPVLPDPSTSIGVDGAPGPAAGSDGAPTEPRPLRKSGLGEVLDPQGRVWRIGANVLPWDPIFAGPLLETGFVSLLGGIDIAVDAATPRRWVQRPSASEGLGLEAILAFVITLVLGAVEGLVLAVAWPVWWAWRRLRGRPLDLTIDTPDDRWVPTPTDLTGWSVRERAHQLRARIETGEVRMPPPETDLNDTYCAGPGQPLVRRSRPIE